MRWLRVLVCLSSWLGFTAAQGKTRDLQICPIKGQKFPAPKGLDMAKAFRHATRSIEEYINANITQSPFNVTSFSIGMFSSVDDGLLFEFHHTDAAVANSGIGTNVIDGDSIYRIASITKVLTVYMWLIKAGDRRFNDPITDFIPALARDKEQMLDYATPDWSEITVNDLATYLAGAARDYGLNDVAIANSVTASFSGDIGPELESTIVPGREDPVCGYFTAEGAYEPCAREVYVEMVSNIAASFPQGYTPLYSNANFALLGIALSNFVGSPEEAIFDEAIKTPLGLTGTTYGNPTAITNHSVIPGGDSKRGWDNQLGPLNGAAGAFTSTNDLVKIGKSILNSTLISGAQTRRWFSSMTFVEQIDQAAGRPWEIFRRKVNGHVVDLYTKGGNWGLYTSVLFLVPEYNFGITLLAASLNASGKVTDSLPNKLLNTLLPALDETARQQANINFGGHYTSPYSNTSVTITTDDGPGLRVTQYISNGIDFLENIFGLFGQDIDFRLIPNHLYGDGKVGFTAVYQPPTKIPTEDTWYYACQSWLDIDDFTYSNVPLGQFVFEVDDSGRACTVELKALRYTLVRKQV